MDNQTAVYWIQHLKLEPHPEGGYYKETFCSDIEVSTSSSAKIKHACTSIYYLLEGTDYSGFHRLRSDEIWYFHKGLALLIHVIGEDGIYKVHELSEEPDGSLSIVIKAGLWFAAELKAKTDFVLVSCAVAPGFDFAEFEMAEAEKMISAYPQHTALFNKLCRK